MSPGAAFLLGGIAVVFIGVGFLVWLFNWFQENERRGQRFLAEFLRSFARTSGYRAVLVHEHDEHAAVSFESIALAIEAGALLLHAPVRLRRSDRPPPPPPSESYGH